MEITEKYFRKLGGSEFVIRLLNNFEVLVNFKETKLESIRDHIMNYIFRYPEEEYHLANFEKFNDILLKAENILNIKLIFEEKILTDFSPYEKYYESINVIRKASGEIYYITSIIELMYYIVINNLENEKFVGYMVDKTNKIIKEFEIFNKF